MEETIENIECEEANNNDDFWEITADEFYTFYMCGQYQI